MNKETIEEIQNIETTIRELITKHNDLARKSGLDARVGLVRGSGAEKTYDYKYDENDNEIEIECEYFEKHFLEIDVEEFEGNGWFPSNFC